MATREELKAILDVWIPKYIRQVVELRSGSRLSAERYNELMNLLITQGDDTIELAETVKQYVELLVEDMTTEFNTTTEVVTNLSNTAVATANSAVATVTEYKTTIDRDIASFKEVVNASTASANNKADDAVATANRLVSDMETYRTELTQLTEQTFEEMRNALSQQVSDSVSTGITNLRDALITDINDTIHALQEQVLTIANTAEQTVNSAIQDIEAYKAGMDARLDAALKEVEDSLSVAGEIIQDASAIYSKINEIDELVKTYEERISALEIGDIVASGINNTDDPNTTEKGLIRTRHANCPTADTEYIIDTTFTDGTDDIYERRQTAYGTGGNNVVYNRAKAYNGSWSEWKQVATMADLANYLPYLGTVSDLFAVTQTGIARYDANTLNTPYKAGLTGATLGLCIINLAGGASYPYYMALPSGTTDIYMAGTAKEWSKYGENYKYTHPNSGVTAGTYSSVTVNAQGHVTAGSNPVLTVAQGGTGKTTAQDAANVFINALSIGDSTPTDADYFVSQYVNGGATYTTFHRRPVSALWNYIKGKADAVYAKLTHTHTKSQITDFPTSLPASDVYAWAKASSKPSYSWSEITSKPTSFTPVSHNQAASTITAGTLAGRVQANASAAATLGNAQVRDMYAGTSDMTAGSTALATGSFYVMYE